MTDRNAVSNATPPPPGSTVSNNNSMANQQGGKDGHGTSPKQHNHHRQWQAALNLLWAASHQGHNATEPNLGGHEMLGPSQSGGMQIDSASGGVKAKASGPSNLAEFLRTVPHFYLLAPAQLNHLVDFALRRDFLPGEVVLEHGTEITQVRVILAGVVDVVDRNHGTVGTMEACSVFGLDSIIIQEKAPFRFVCSRACSLLLLPGTEVLRLLQKSSCMRQSIGRKMSGQMSCFRTLKEFARLLFSHEAMKYEYIPLHAILESYNAMTDSVVHPLKSRREIDTTAWYYAIQRLPENITRVFSLDLVRSLPPFLATRMRSLTRKAERARQSDGSTNDHTSGSVGIQQYFPNVHHQGNPSDNQQHHARKPSFGSMSPATPFLLHNASVFGASTDAIFSSPATQSPITAFQSLYNDYRSRDIRYVHTSQRRRCVWQLGIDGKNIVLMRDDFTDYLDFVLSISIHIIESSKLRGRLQSLVSPSAIDVIEESMMKCQMMAHQQLVQQQQQQQYQQQQQQQQTNGSPFLHATLPRTQSGVPVTLANATGYNGLRDITGVVHPSNPGTPNSPSSGQHRQGGGGALLSSLHLSKPPSSESSSRQTSMPTSPTVSLGGFTQEQLENILQHQLYLSEEESKGIISIWGNQTLLHLHDVLMHREEYLLRADSSVARRFQSDPFHDWALGVRGAVVRRLALDPHSPLPTNLTIDLVFGLTRSFLNCLSPCARLYREEILEYGNRAHPEVVSQPSWNSEEDMLYALIPDFLNENPTMRDTFNSVLEESGIEVLEDTALTGLQADIICADFLDLSNVDEWLQKKLRSSPTFASGSGSSSGSHPKSSNHPSFLPHQSDHAGAGHSASVDFDGKAGAGGNNRQGAHFLINIDYTFGAQAEGILKTLVTLFATRIRSVNVVGKIAGFKGTKAGDVIIADSVVASKMSLTSEDHMDEIRTINNQGVRLERVQEFLGNSNKRKVRRGSVITVATAMLCDRSIISYYKNIWNCIGFEIEGSYFARMVKECKSNGLLQNDLPTRHVYLVRELPEEADGSSTFAKPRYAAEVLAAQYAIARSILDLILRKDHSPHSLGSNQHGGTTIIGNGDAQQQQQQQRHPHFGAIQHQVASGMLRTVTAPSTSFM